MRTRTGWIAGFLSLALVSGAVVQSATAGVPPPAPITAPVAELSPAEVQKMRLSAQIGAGPSQYELGNWYLLGRDGRGEKQFGTALTWLNKAAQQGDAWAEWDLSHMYRNGQGVAADVATANDWLRKAAGHGLGLAQNELGVMFARGDGVKRDYVEAYMWMDLAVAAKDGRRRDNGFATNRSTVATQMTPAQVTAAKARAKAWKPTADTVERQAMLGFQAYNDGDYATALRLLTPLAEQGQPTAQMALGMMYSTGEGVTRDDAKAVDLLRKAADQGEPGAQLMMGVILQSGRGTPQDSAAALAYFRLAANQGLAEAQTALGDMYFNGVGVEASPKVALAWLVRAAAQGNATAQHRLGVLYFEGKVVPKNNVEAYKWTMLATRSTEYEVVVKPIRTLLNEIAAESSEAERREAEAKVAEWRPVFEVR